MPPRRFELRLSRPQRDVLSIELWGLDRYHLNDEL